jgi:hypothetical protein
VAVNRLDGSADHVHDLLENVVMTHAKIAESLERQLAQLPLEYQQRVLRFAEALVSSLDRGVPGQRLAHLAGTLTAEDARSMSEEIDRACERVRADDW